MTSLPVSRSQSMRREDSEVRRVGGKNTWVLHIQENNDYRLSHMTPTLTFDFWPCQDGVCQLFWWQFCWWMLSWGQLSITRSNVSVIKRRWGNTIAKHILHMMHRTECNNILSTYISFLSLVVIKKPCEVASSFWYKSTFNKKCKSLYNPLDSPFLLSWSIFISCFTMWLQQNHNLYKAELCYPHRWLPAIE